MTTNEEVDMFERIGKLVETLEAVRKVRDGYAEQAKFADPEPAAYFREFVRRIEAALARQP